MKKIITAILIMLICFSDVNIAKAENYWDRETDYEADPVVNMGKDIIISDKKGNYGSEVVSIKGFWLDAVIVSNDDIVYFLAYKKKSDDFYVKRNIRLYALDFKTKKKRLIKKLDSKYTDAHLIEAYDGYIYIVLRDKKGEYTFRYNVKKNTFKKLIDAGVYLKYGNKFVFQKYPPSNSSVVFPANFTIYNSKTGKWKTPEKKPTIGLVRYGRYLYYAVPLDGNGSTINVKKSYRVFRYDIKTGKKKIILKSGDFYNIDLITERYVYHGTMGWLKNKDYRYDLKKKE